jgi:predicted enzyme related to lactoylglutathione lyase
LFSVEPVTFSLSFWEVEAMVDFYSSGFSVSLSSLEPTTFSLSL